MKRVVAALLAGAAGLGAAPALAADLMEPVPVAPVYEPAAPTAFDWTGFYVGANAAYLWGEGSSQAVDGFGGGLYAGYNYALTPEWIVGAEADVMGFTDESLTIGGVSATSDMPIMSTIRARVGYAFDRVMVYGTGGLAVGFGEAKFNGGSDSNTHLGWAAGAGIEAALTDNITARAEYLYVDTSSETYSVGGTSGDMSMDGSTVKVGVGYKF